MARRGHVAALALIALIAAVTGCKTTRQVRVARRPEEPLTAYVNPLAVHPFRPSNQRHWQANMMELPRATVMGDRIHIENIRNCRYVTEEDYVVDYHDATFDLNELDSVDFMLVPFQHVPELAHTMLGFGFRDGRHFIVSVEARLEEGEKYSPLGGALGQYELMYVVGDERDLILLRTEHRDADVYVYRTKSEAWHRRALLMDIARRMNRLSETPEFYDSLRNNCTTNIVDHLNHLRPGTIPPNYQVLLAGTSDRLFYDLGLLETDLPFETAKRRARVNELAHLHRDADDFSARIRRR